MSAVQEMLNELIRYRMQPRRKIRAVYNLVQRMEPRRRTCPSCYLVFRHVFTSARF